MGEVTRGLFASLIVVMLASHSVLAVSAVELGKGISLSDEDLGLNGVEVDSEGNTAVIYGQD